MRKIIQKKKSLPKKNRPKGFTLLELILVMTGFFLLLTIVLQMYIKIVKIKYGVEARQNILQESYYTLEKIAIEMKDYTIDYEEYFNRKFIGCDGTAIGDNFVRDINSGNANGFCDNFTAYGNQNSIVGGTADERNHYHCSSKTGYNSAEETVIEDLDIRLGSGCMDLDLLNSPYRQSYGQYARHFIDVQDDVDFNTGAINDNDDEDLGKGPKAIMDTKNVQELYLISQDGTRRIFLRRALVATGDWDGDGLPNGATEKKYTIQMLKLKGFDAGKKHNFDPTTPGVYDGVIDTWACDFSQGFVCDGAAIDSILYSGYFLPSDENDGWVNLLESNISLADRNLVIYPNKKGSYAWLENVAQINPYIQLSMQTNLFGETRKNRLDEQTIDAFQLTLQTTLNTKNFYSK